MGTKHTPGRWEAHNNGKFWEVRSVESQYLKTKLMINTFVWDKQSALLLTQSEEEAANAKLIAQVPPMIEVLLRVQGMRNLIEYPADVADYLTDDAERIKAVLDEIDLVIKDAI